jgi:hypothetical protein
MTLENCAVVPGWFPINVATLTDPATVAVPRRGQLVIGR